ncbi:MAG: 4Fe-4S binding domain protein [candidate division TM6 bacterium GW2011_GWF2_38_10]|nr:MAG: 4Fe-4S binding domain protein [candidate division TM6 bacterium GW2011_GWF2_38_10]
MKKVNIEPGCVSCGSCAAICPHVFKVSKGASVIEGADLEKYAECIKEAADMCPVQVIVVTDSKE